MSDRAPALEIRDYALSYRGPTTAIRILDDLSLTIHRGEVVGLVGESGSAKSSLANAVIRALPGRIAHEAGQIRLGGRELRTLPAAELEAIRGTRIAMVFQNAASALNPTRTLGSHMRELLKRHRDLTGAAAEEHLRKAFATVGLPDTEAMARRYAHQVSGGEKQRVVLALALACDPELLLFDEPTSALDATTAATLLDLVRDLRRRTGIAGLFISHDLGVVADIADRIAVMYGGRIVEMATPEALFTDPRHPYSRALLASLPRPTDTRSGRRLNVAGGVPAPRTGPPPPCIYAGACAFRAPGICDARPVHLRRTDARALACARAGEVTGKSVTPGNWPAPTRPRGDCLLTVENLSVIYGHDTLFGRPTGRRRRAVHAVNHASVCLSRGETLGLVGESGCGKSTLTRALARAAIRGHGSRRRGSLSVRSCRDARMADRLFGVGNLLSRGGDSARRGPRLDPAPPRRTAMP